MTKAVRRGAFATRVTYKIYNPKKPELAHAGRRRYFSFIYPLNRSSGPAKRFWPSDKGIVVFVPPLRPQTRSGKVIAFRNDCLISFCSGFFTALSRRGFRRNKRPRSRDSDFFVTFLNSSSIATPRRTQRTCRRTYLRRVKSRKKRSLVRIKSIIKSQSNSACSRIMLHYTRNRTVWCTPIRVEFTEPKQLVESTRQCSNFDRCGVPLNSVVRVRYSVTACNRWGRVCIYENR